MAEGKRLLQAVIVDDDRAHRDVAGLVEDDALFVIDDEGRIDLLKTRIREDDEADEIGLDEASGEERVFHNLLMLG